MCIFLLLLILVYFYNDCLVYLFFFLSFYTSLISLSFLVFLLFVCSYNNFLFHTLPLSFSFLYFFFLFLFRLISFFLLFFSFFSFFSLLSFFAFFIAISSSGFNSFLSVSALNDNCFIIILYYAFPFAFHSSIPLFYYSGFSIFYFFFICQRYFNTFCLFFFLHLFFSYLPSLSLFKRIIRYEILLYNISFFSAESTLFALIASAFLLYAKNAILFHDVHLPPTYIKASFSYLQRTWAMTVSKKAWKTGQILSSTLLLHPLSSQQITFTTFFHHNYGEFID